MRVEEICKRNLPVSMMVLEMRCYVKEMLRRASGGQVYILFGHMLCVIAMTRWLRRLL